jgi:hypothetical protein
MSAAIAATGDLMAACITGDRFIDIPSGTAGIVGRAGAVGTAGSTGVGVLGTGITGVLGAGVIGAMVVLGAGVGTTGAGMAAGALGIGNGAGDAVGGLVGGVTGAEIAGLGGVTGFIGRVRGASAIRPIGGKNALPRLGSIVRPRGGSPVERSGMNLGAFPTLAVPAAPAWGAAPSKTEVVGEKILGLPPAFAFIFGAVPDSNTEVDGAATEGVAAGADFIRGGVIGLALVIGMAGGVGTGIAGGAESLPKSRLSRPGFFCGSIIGSGMAAGAATVLRRAGGRVILGCTPGGFSRAGPGSSAILELIAFGTRGVVGVPGALSVAGALAGAEVAWCIAGEVDAFMAGGAAAGAFAPLSGSGGMWLLSIRVKTSPDFMSLTSDWYDPSGSRSVFTILTFFSAPLSKRSVMTSPTFGGVGEASLPAPSASPTAAVIPNTPVQTHRFQTHRFMADSVQHASPAPSVAAGRQSMPAQ